MCPLHTAKQTKATSACEPMAKKQKQYHCEPVANTIDAVLCTLHFIMPWFMFCTRKLLFGKAVLSVLSRGMKTAPSGLCGKATAGRLASTQIIYLHCSIYLAASIPHTQAHVQVKPHNLIRMNQECYLNGYNKPFLF